MMMMMILIYRVQYINIYIYIYIYNDRVFKRIIYIILLNTLSSGKSCLVVPEVAVPP